MGWLRPTTSAHSTLNPDHAWRSTALRGFYLSGLGAGLVSLIW